MSIRAKIIEEAKRWGLTPADLPQYVGEVGKRIRIAVTCVDVTTTKPRINHGFHAITFVDADANILHSSEYATKACSFTVGEKYDLWATPIRHYLHLSEKVTFISKIRIAKNEFKSA